MYIFRKINFPVSMHPNRCRDEKKAQVVRWSPLTRNCPQKLSVYEDVGKHSHLWLPLGPCRGHSGWSEGPHLGWHRYDLCWIIWSLEQWSMLYASSHEQLELFVYVCVCQKKFWGPSFWHLYPLHYPWLMHMGSGSMIQGTKNGGGGG